MRRRSTTRSAPQASESGSASRNSSPPMRPQTSPGRNSPRITRAAICSASSPAAWPDAWLSFSKWSMSSVTTATFSPRVLAFSSASCSASCRPRWLSTPVSGSLSTSPSIRACSARIVPPSASIVPASTPIASRRRQPSDTTGLPAATSIALRESRSTGRTMRSHVSAPTPITSRIPAPRPATSTSRRPVAWASARSSSVKRRRSTATARPRPSRIGKESWAALPFRVYALCVGRLASASTTVTSVRSGCTPLRRSARARMRAISSRSRGPSERAKPWARVAASAAPVQR